MAEQVIQLSTSQVRHCPDWYSRLPWQTSQPPLMLQVTQLATLQTTHPVLSVVCTYPVAQVSHCWSPVPAQVSQFSILQSCIQAAVPKRTKLSRQVLQVFPEQSTHQLIPQLGTQLLLVATKVKLVLQVPQTSADVQVAQSEMLQFNWQVPSA